MIFRKSKKKDKYIIIKGAREHNLKNIDLDIPRDKFVVFTGLSGSGKSTLAFDTIFAEGQRRYLESLSSYARQFLGQMNKPDVDLIEGLSPAISIDQKTTTHNPRSTVGTVTEIHDYLRLLFAKIGVYRCPKCRDNVKPFTIDEIVSQILDFGTSKECEILAPIVRDRKGTYLKLLSDMWDRGFLEGYIDGKKYNLDEIGELELDRYKKHNIEIVVDSIEINEDNISRIFESVEIATKIADGLVFVKSGNDLRFFNKKKACPKHPDIVFAELEPRFFSFNSPYGACELCEGLGVKKQIDTSLILFDKNKTIAEGGFLPWTNKKQNTYLGGVLSSVMRFYDIEDNIRLRDINTKKLDLLMYGAKEPDKISVKVRSKKGSVWNFSVTWRGIIGFLEDRYRKTDSDNVRREIEQYMSSKPCQKCSGDRFKEEVLWVYFKDKNIKDISSMNIDETITFFENIKLTKKEEIIGLRIIKEIISRLSFLSKDGLGYLNLSRSAHTLSGGESQRIRLASQIGSQLVGVLYILDEPSIGLHARDNAKLLETLLHLRDLGNSVIVIEHDEETMLSADHIVDIGPGAGKHGGRIIASGTPEEIKKNKNSLTAKYLIGEEKIAVPKERKSIKSRDFLSIRGAAEHNLKNINVNFPLGLFTVVTGVSGSGKSTLVEDILYKAVSSKIMRTSKRAGKYKEILGIENLDKVIMIDQSPIGRTPRSNPATYTSVFTLIRELFASTKDAKIRGYSPGRFSFNVTGGRCENCKGDGYLKIEMQFMSDVFLPCDVCNGKRYNSETLQVRYKDKNIADVLDMTVNEAVLFFDNYPRIYKYLKVLQDVGLGYIHLGQSATTLSGGEAQRIKLATELAKKSTGKTLYILDEPTTGLHFADVEKLLSIIHRLRNSGNTIIIIEHNMDVIKNADWIIDMGPEGGEQGGKIVISGTPEDIINYSDISHTAKFLKKVLKVDYLK